MRHAVSEPVLTPKRSGKSEPLGDSSQFCSDVACSSPHVAGRVSRAWEVSGHDLWSCSESSGDHRHSTHAPCSSAPITRSSSPIWVLELFAHVMHEPMRLATLKRTLTRVRPSQNGPGSEIWVENRFPRRKTFYGHHDAGISAPANLLCATIVSSPQRLEIPNGAAQNASRPRTTLSSEPNNRVDW